MYIVVVVVVVAVAVVDVRIPKAAAHTPNASPSVIHSAITFDRIKNNANTFILL
jgi:hypothetical protein